MSTEVITVLTGRIKSIPILPAVVNQVMGIIADPKSEAQDLLKVIQPDISLTTMILKIANSAFYGYSRDISSLLEAVKLLGFKEIQNIVITKAVFDTFKNTDSVNGFDVKGFWEHSFLCGLSAKVLASSLQKLQSDSFVGGLIHDIGKLVMFLALPIEYSNMIENIHPPGQSSYKSEREIFGISHDEVGLRLLKRWMFPEELLKAVGSHHSTSDIKNGQIFPFIIHIADLLSHLCEGQVNNEADIGFSKELVYPEILILAQACGVDWRNTDLDRFLEDVENLREQEAATLSIFLS